MDDYESAIRYTDADKVNLLLCHNPDIHEQMRESDGIDAVFSGHTHGGQIRFGRFGPYELGGTGTVKSALPDQQRLRDDKSSAEARGETGDAYDYAVRTG